MKWLFWLLPAIVAAWSAQELEIFRLRDAVVGEFGPDATFYSWLNVAKNADAKTIQKAYNKLSRAIHPDKAPGPDAQERYSRLTRINKILRSGARDTYDFYLRKGFPGLVEDDYKFNRYRPGFGITVAIVLVVATLLHYLILHTSAQRQRQFFQKLIDDALAQASGKLGAVTSKTRVSLDGKIFAVYPDLSVYYIDGSDEVMVTPDEVPQPTIFDTFLLRFVKPSSHNAPAEPVTAEKSEPLRRSARNKAKSS